VIFSAFAGAVVDRADRKVIFVITQIAFLLMALFLGVMTYVPLTVTACGAVTLVLVGYTLLSRP
jgi:hypothetical protein